jgi:hypothetical protein
MVSTSITAKVQPIKLFIEHADAKNVRYMIHWYIISQNPVEFMVATGL